MPRGVFHFPVLRGALFRLLATYWHWMLIIPVILVHPCVILRVLPVFVVWRMGLVRSLVSLAAQIDLLFLDVVGLGLCLRF